jgi:hypothetical protein
MSADNWANCPKCHKKPVSQDEYAASIYGTVTVSKFLAMVSAYKPAPEDGMLTLRENYEVGISEGKFFVNYRASCSCGFHYEFKRQNIEI